MNIKLTKKDDKSTSLILIGQECAKIRRKAKWSQEKMADITGYSQQMISAFEKGYQNNLHLYLWYKKLQFVVNEKSN